MPTFVTPTTYTPTTNNSWNDIDCSALVPAGASGVMCYLKGGGDQTGLRKKGSTDNIITYLGSGEFTSVCIGVDASRIFQQYKTSGDSPTVVVYGYFTSTEATFFTNYTSYTLGSGYTFTDCDISAISTGALAAIGFVAVSNSGFACRKKGSTDSRINDNGSYSYGGFIVGVDTNKIFQAATANGSDVVYVNGYITANITTYTNGIDRTPGTTGSYQTLTALPAGATAGLYEIASNGSSGLRKHGDSFDNYAANGKAQRNQIVEADTSQLVDAKISASSVKIYETGYFTAPGSGISSKLLSQLANQGGF